MYSYLIFRVEHLTWYDTGTWNFLLCQLKSWNTFSRCKVTVCDNNKEKFQCVLLDLRIKMLLHVYRISDNIELMCVAESQQITSTEQSPSWEGNILAS